MMTSSVLEEYKKQVQRPLSLFLSLVEKGHHQAAVDLAPAAREDLQRFELWLTQVMESERQSQEAMKSLASSLDSQTTSAPTEAAQPNPQKA